MGTPFRNAASIPSVLDYERWQTVLAGVIDLRLRECPRERGTTYYFSTSGSNANDGLTSGTPKQTLAHAQALLALHGSDVRIRLKRGDTWEETTGLTLSYPNCTLDDFGTGAKPLLNRFTVKYASGGGGWTLVTGTRYSRTEANDLAWVRKVANRLDAPISRASSNTGAGGIAGNWYYWASNTLTIDIGVDPNTVNLEAVIGNSASGVTVSGDGCRVENIRGDGWGCHRTITATQAEGIHTAMSGTDVAALVGCESYYGSSHAMAQYYNGSGGSVLFLSCLAGYTKFNSSGETVFNSFSADGQHEAIWVDCQAVYGTLPSADWYNAATAARRGRAFYAHTTTGTCQWHITHRCRVPDNAFGATVGALFGNLPAGDVATARGLVVEETIEGGLGTGNNLFISGLYQVTYGAAWRLRPHDPGGTRALNGGTAANGYFVNGIVRIDLSGISGSRAAFWNALTATDSTIRILHSRFEFEAGTQDFDFDYDRGSTEALIANSVIVKRSGSNTIGIGTNNLAATLRNNAYYGIAGTGSRAYSNDAGKVELADFLDGDHMPTEASPLYQAGVTDLGVRFDHDGRWIGGKPSIGPRTAFARRPSAPRGRFPHLG